MSGLAALTARLKQAAAPMTSEERQQRVRQDEETATAALRRELAAQQPPQAVGTFYVRGTVGTAPPPDMPADITAAATAAGRAVSVAELRHKLRSAGRQVEIERYLALIAAWDGDATSKAWDVLSQVAKPTFNPADGSSEPSVQYDAYRRAVGIFRAWLRGRDAPPELQMDPAAAPSLEVLMCGNCGVQGKPSDSAGDARPAGGDVTHLFAPKLDAHLFLSCPRSPSGAVELTTLYSGLMIQVSVFKAMAELLMRDDDNDGYLTELEVETYVRDLWRQIPCLQDASEQLIPFYACSVARRLLWALEDRKAGIVLRQRVSINALVAHQELRHWIEVQLAPEDIPNNWYGPSCALALYNKFVKLDRRGDGMLTRADMGLYKKGIPPTGEDGLPPDVSPICDLFLDRYFEATQTFAGELDYKNFVDFTLNVEFLPQCPRPQLFFDILDLDGSGVLTPMKFNCFFKETHAKLENAGVDPPSLETVVSEAFDALRPAQPLLCTRAEFCSSKQAGTVVMMLIDCLGFYAYDRRDHNVGDKQQRLHLYEQPIRR